MWCTFPQLTSRCCCTRCTLTAATAFTLSGLGGANALHHLLACSTCSRLHDVTAWWFACTAPDGLATHGNRLCLFTGFRAKLWHRHDGNFLLGKAFNFHHEAFFVHADQADGVAFTARTACTADAVHVVFGDVRNFVVDDVGQLINVDAAGSNVGGYQGSQLAGLETRQGLRSCALALVAMQRHGGYAVLGQVLGHMVGAKFGACEHQHLAPVVLVDDVQQHFFFLGAAHRVNHLLDALHRRVAGRDLNALWVFEQVVGQGADVIAEGGREQQALLVGRHQRQNFFDVVDKAHVQHAVGLVQHQHFNVGQIHEALLL